MSGRFDLVVIGAGMAGMTAANKCAAQGWQVGIVDELPYGGTCALRGCDPKKILRRGADQLCPDRLGGPQLRPVNNVLRVGMNGCLLFFAFSDEDLRPGH